MITRPTSSDTADACHGHVTPSKVYESHNFNILQRLHLSPSRKILCIVAEVPKVLKPKEEKISSFSE